MKLFKNCLFILLLTIFLPASATIVEMNKLIDKIYGTIDIPTATKERCIQIARYNDWPVNEITTEDYYGIDTDLQYMFLSSDGSAVDRIDVYWNKKTNKVASYGIYIQFNKDSMKDALMLMERTEQTLESKGVKFDYDPDINFDSNKYSYGYVGKYDGGKIQLMVFKNYFGYMFRIIREM